MQNKISKRLLAILLPGGHFYSQDRIKAAIAATILQATLIGWVPAALWAFFSLDEFSSEKRIERTLNQLTKIQ